MARLQSRRPGDSLRHFFLWRHLMLFDGKLRAANNYLFYLIFHPSSARDRAPAWHPNVVYSLLLESLRHYGSDERSGERLKDDNVKMRIVKRLLPPGAGLWITWRVTHFEVIAGETFVFIPCGLLPVEPPPKAAGIWFHPSTVVLGNSLWFSSSLNRESSSKLRFNLSLG